MTEVASITYELNVSYDGDEGEEAPVFRVADQFGFEHVASGGNRDLHFERNTPITETEREQITQALKDLDFPVDATIEAWRYDVAGEAIEDDQGNDSWELLSEL